jgi:hypothetical protein
MGWSGYHARDVFLVFDVVIPEFIHQPLLFKNAADKKI